MAGTFKTRSHHSMGSLRTSSGLIMMVNFLLLLMATWMSFTWRTNARHYPEKFFKDLIDPWFYHLLAVAIPCVAYLLIQIIANCCCECNNFKGLSDIVMMIASFVFGVLIIVSGIFLHLTIYDKKCVEQRNCQQIESSVIVGYVGAALLFAESYFHLSEKNIVMKMV